MGTTISESHHFIFVHIPKTAGLSIASQVAPYRRNPGLDRKAIRSAINLLNIYTGASIEERLGGRIIPEHAGLSTLIKLDPELDLDRYYKFAVVRNPWDRIVSMFSYHQGHARTRYLRPGYWRTRNLDFETWLETVHARRRRAGLIKSQYDMLSLPRQDRVMVEQVLRFENLGEDYAKLAERLDFPQKTLPALNRSRHGDYRKRHSEQTRALVAELYRDDIEAFGYDFG